MKKFLPYIFILTVLVGLWVSPLLTEAQEDRIGRCYLGTTNLGRMTEAQCLRRGTTARWVYPDPGRDAPPPEGAQQFASSGNALLDEIGETCGFTNPIGCLLYIVYALFVALPSFLLGYVAVFFNFMAQKTLDSGLYEAQFIEQIWGIVRDFANIFFILVLLYAAFQTILGIGHGSAKKIVANVILIALLVNFSLFFTKIVIDASNIMALIFYNKVDTSEVHNTTVGSPQDSNVLQKDIGGAFASRFNPNSFFDQTTFDHLEEYGRQNGVGNGINDYVLLAMIIIYGIVIYSMIYALFIAGFSLLGRTLMLMALMIVSPFAFVSYAVPGLKKVPTVGFDSWLHKLIETSFIAAIFMFILYLISQVLAANIFGSARPDEGILGKLIFIFLPGVLITMLLLKGASYAKKASGEFTGKLIGGAAALGGLALGGAALTTGLVGRATVGTFMRGASTGDTAAARIRAEQSRRAAGVVNWRDPHLTTLQRVAGNLSIGSRIDSLQQRIGANISAKQAEQEKGRHARHELDTEANKVAPGKKWEQLTGAQRDLVRKNTEREFERRSNAATAGRSWDKLTTAERAAIDAAIAPRIAAKTTHLDDHEIKESRIKQNLSGALVESSITGSYDIRGLANVVAKEQSKTLTKIAAGLTGAVAMGMRGGLKQIGMNLGTPQGAFFKDLGNTISEALKSVKINVDLSHVGEQKKEGDKGGGHH